MAFWGKGGGNAVCGALRERNAPPFEEKEEKKRGGKEETIRRSFNVGGKRGKRKGGKETLSAPAIIEKKKSSFRVRGKKRRGKERRGKTSRLLQGEGRKKGPSSSPRQKKKPVSIAWKGHLPKDTCNHGKVKEKELPLTSNLGKKGADYSVHRPKKRKGKKKGSNCRDGTWTERQNSFLFSPDR